MDFCQSYSYEEDKKSSLEDQREFLWENHRKLLAELNQKYVVYWENLMKMKEKIQAKMQESFYNQLNEINQLIINENMEKYKHQYTLNHSNNNNAFMQFKTELPMNSEHLAIKKEENCLNNGNIVKFETEETHCDYPINNDMRDNNNSPMMTEKMNHDDDTNCYCICGNVLVKIDHNPYPGKTILCDLCSNEIPECNDRFYHCPKNKNPVIHPMGYDICQSCVNIGSDKPFGNTYHVYDASSLVKEDTDVLTQKGLNFNNGFGSSVMKNDKSDDNDGRFECNECGYKASSMRSVALHKKIHEKPYKCSICYKSFKTKKYVKQHKLTIHENIRPFVCGFCDKRFPQRYQLKKHLVKHTNIISEKLAIAN